MIRKKYLLVFLIILSSGLLFAQDLSLGMKDGITVSGISGSFNYKNFDQTKITNRVGHSFGLLLNYRLNNFFSLQLEMNYEEKGFFFKNAPMLLGFSYSGNFKLKYLTFPIISCFEIGKKVKYYGYAGFYTGFLLKAENYTSFISTSSSELIKYDESYDPSDIFNKYEFGGLTGMGIKIPLCEKVAFIIDARYNFGLTKAAKNTDFDNDSNHYTEDTPDNFQNVYNQFFSMSLGILYSLQKR